LQLDDNFKQLIKELGEAINESLADSDNISDVMGRIRAAGLRLFLVLEVTIGFNKQGQSGTILQKDLTAGTDLKEPEFLLTSEDARFLRSLRIVVEQDKD